MSVGAAATVSLGCVVVSPHQRGAVATFRWQKWGRGRCRRVVVVACSSSPRRRCASTAVLTHPLALAVKRSSDACCGAAAAAPARLQRGSDCEGHLGVQRLSGAPGAAAIVRGTRGLQRFACDVVVSSSSCRIVVAVTSSSRRVVAASSSPRRRIPPRRGSGGNVRSVSLCRSRVVAARRRRSPSSPSPPLSSPAALTTSAGRRAVVCSPVSHGYPHPPALTASAGRRAVVSSAPPSILTAILTHPQHLYLKPVMEGGCSDCEDLGLGALQRGWGCSGAWGLQLLWGPGHCSEAAGLQGAAAS